MRLRAAYFYLRRSSNLVFSSFGMTSDQYVVLALLVEEGEATQQELVRRCYSDAATMGSMVSLLEAKGLLTRRPHPHDGRARSVALTRTGRALAEEMRWRSSSLRANLVALFEDHEVPTLIEYLERIAGSMPPPERKATPTSLRRADQRPRPSRKEGTRSGSKKHGYETRTDMQASLTQTP